MATAKRLKGLKEAFAVANGTEVANLLKSLTSNHSQLAETLRCAAVAIEDDHHAFQGVASLIKPDPYVIVSGRGRLRFSFGAERAAWRRS